IPTTLLARPICCQLMSESTGSRAQRTLSRVAAKSLLLRAVIATTLLACPICCQLIFESTGSRAQRRLSPVAAKSLLLMAAIPTTLLAWPICCHGDGITAEESGDENW